jgi:hypothetical protein
MEHALEILAALFVVIAIAGFVIAQCVGYVAGTTGKARNEVKPF